MRQLKITKTITSRDEKSLDKYLTEVSKYDPLTPEQEIEAATMIQSGNPELISKGAELLIKHNLRFVISVAKQYQKISGAFTLGDLINYGNEGLIKAAYRFDHTRGFKFISYSVWWIRQRLLEALATEGRVIRVPLNQNGRSSKVNSIIRDLQQIFSREPSADEINEEFARREIVAYAEKKGLKLLDEEFDNLVEKELKKMNNASVSLQELAVTTSRPSSLDSFIGEDESLRMIDMIQSDGYSTMNHDMDRKDMHDVLMRQMKKHLAKREIDVLQMVFGLDGREPRTLEEVGVRMELTRERVRQIKEKAIRKMKGSAKSGSVSTMRQYLN
jgi:RNA polymerase primary sigma factor